MTKKILTIQDISCYGSCSITVALPILSHYGFETVILPSAILSTHTSGFKNFVVDDLTDFMPKIVNHWVDEGLKFDVIYTGYIGDERQFDLILEIKDKLLKKDGLFFVDPAMADHGKLYPALNQRIVEGMKKIVSQADYIIPNITEAAFLTNNEYKETYDVSYIEALSKDLYKLGAKNVMITGFRQNDLVGNGYYDGKKFDAVYNEWQEKSYHGTGDIYSSVVLANLMNGKSTLEALDDAAKFVIKCIKKTVDDNDHWYSVKFEEVLHDETK
ncbi:MAG: pyridoxamine kinase [Acholeplasmatales bacterium]|nr:pyridoxamine kinase [Acholeplasmatales bacterium]